MCILAFCCHASPRWPVVFVHNRDEFVHRATEALRVDANGLLWAQDSSIGDGGSWLGFNVASGAFAALTNCRRAPTTVADFPFEVIRQHSAVDAKGRVQFTPDSSRGVLVRDFLLRNALPPVHAWCAPVFNGYNLVTANLYNDALHLFHYTTNRYGLQHSAPIGGGVHAMANSFLDNPSEPKTVYLRDALQSVVQQCDSGSDAKAMIGALGQLLCAQNGFDVRDADVLQSTKPYLGLTSTQKELLIGRPLEDGDRDEIFIGDWNATSEALLHRDVFVTACGPSYGTRTQTVVLVENHTNASTNAAQRTVHVAMRNTTSPTLVDDWAVHSFPVPQQ